MKRNTTFCFVPRFHFALASMLAAALMAFAPLTATAADTGDTVLVRRGDIAITKADYDAELLRIPPEHRADFAANPRRNIQLIERMLSTRELAAQAKERKLDQDVVTKSRIRLDEDRLLAAALLAQIEEGAALQFDLQLPAWERRARELYAVDRAKYAAPEMVMLTQVVFSTDKDGADGAQKRAADAMAKLKAGADIGDLAATVSDDTPSRAVRGRSGPFARADLDPALAAATFALKKPGDISELVKAPKGWYIVRLDERKPPAARTFDEVKPQILAELKQKHVGDARDKALSAVGAGKEIVVDQGAVDALRTTPKTTF